KSGARSVAPRDCRLMRAIVVSGLSGRPGRPIGGRGSGYGCGFLLRCAPEPRSPCLHRHEGQTEGRYASCYRPGSALQTHLQGMDRAAMTAVIKELDHAAPPFQADEPGLLLAAAAASGNPIALPELIRGAVGSAYSNLPILASPPASIECTTCEVGVPLASSE